MRRCTSSETGRAGESSRRQVIDGIVTISLVVSLVVAPSFLNELFTSPFVALFNNWCPRPRPYIFGICREEG